MPTRHVVARAKRGVNPRSRPTTKATARTDMYKQFASEYAAGKTPALIEVGDATYLTIDGTGEPGGTAFGAAVGALYTVAYGAKMASKAAGRDYAVSKLEALWWCDPDSARFAATKRENWHWKLLIRLPDFVTQADVEAAADAALAKGKTPLVRGVHREVIREGRCVQMLHVGPYAEEPRSVAMMEAAAAEAGVHFAGRHHEIYLSDPGRTAPERLRTILRMPVAG